jgi:hypothetical protein
MMTLVALMLLAADPHPALIVPERLGELDQQAAKIARDIAKEDRGVRDLTRASPTTPDGGVPAELAEVKADLAKLHSELDDDVAAVKALKDSKTGVTVDAARAVGDKLAALGGRVEDLSKRLQRLAHKK